MTVLIFGCINSTEQRKRAERKGQTSGSDTLQTNAPKTERKNTIKNEYISNYQSSESIVKLLLDKIINISIHQSDMNKINRQINSYCFEYLQNQIDPLCEETFMNYTKLKNDTNTLFWKATKPPENQWIEIMEPEPVQNDRYENSEIQ